jgi:hypothetical protein
MGERKGGKKGKWVKGQKEERVEEMIKGNK